MEKILSTKKVFQGKVVSVDEVNIEFGHNNHATFELVKFNVETGVSALAIDNHDQVYLIEHFQLGVGKRILTLPTGGLEFGEDPTQRMQLELQEEIGFKAKKIELMFQAHAIPGYIGTKPFYTYLATDLTPSKLEGDEFEDMVIHQMPIDQVVQMIKTNRITDSRIIIAVLYYQQFYKNK